MAFKINEFKAGIHKYGGPSHANLFEVTFTFGNGWAPNSEMDSRDLTLFCSSAAIPGMQADTATYQPVGGKAKTYITGMSHDQLACQFMLDSNHQIKSLFHSWMQRVVNYSTAAGNFSEYNGMLPYEVGYRDEYCATCTIKHYTTYANDGYYLTRLNKVFPIALGDVDLNWSSEGVAVMGVGFQYDSIEYQGEITGSPTTRLNRGNGLFDLLSSVSVIGQTFNLGFSLPDSLQDAVNRVNRVSNAWDQITNLFK